MTIEVIFWDFGGVFTPSPFDAVGIYGAGMGADPDAYRAMVFGDYGVDGDHAWHRLERGEVSMIDAITEITILVKSAGYDFDPQEMFGSMSSDEPGVQPEVLAAVMAHNEAGFRQAIITNNVKEFSDGWRSMLPVDDLFVDVVDSSAVGLRKPDPAIFELALERLGIASAAGVFLDDFLPNVEAARALGFRGIHVGPDPGPALAELSDLLS